METVNNRCIGNCSSCGKCKGANILDEMNNRKTKPSFMPDDFTADEMEKYGISFDIGTTTVVGNLWNLKKGISLQIVAKTNPQNIFGADVISRINYCEDNPIKFIKIRDKIIDCLNEIIEELLIGNQVDKQNIVKITVVGNTTMSHIFAGFNPKPLARSPFTPAFTGEKEFKAYELRLNINPETNVILLPNIAGHVGSDITGGVLATRLEKLNGMNLYIDIGTNGEIVLTKDYKTYACSTAAGPAFEGAAIYQGMRAASGAIESIQIKNGTVFFKTIDKSEPVGICGSGLIEALSEMIKNGMINKTGRLLLPGEIKGEPLKGDLPLRLRVGPKGREFVLVFKENTEDIVITQMDIREVQLAKGAIYAGIKLMLSELHEEIENIDRVIIAGAFGTYIDKDSGLTIGILPNISPDKITFVGNAAGTGSSLVLLSEKERNRANKIVSNIEHLELATCKNFQEEYLKAMSF